MYVSGVGNVCLQLSGHLNLISLRGRYHLGSNFILVLCDKGKTPDMLELGGIGLGMGLGLVWV